jgi:hypothetical protein
MTMTTKETADTRIQFERDHRAPNDLELEPLTSEDADYESAPPDYQISTYPADFTLEGLHLKWKAGEIRIPEFQRGFVWKQVQSSKLIESFLVGLPVPPVYLYSEQKTQYLLVIDGQQRLKSIFYFFDGLFGEETQGLRRVFRLTGLSDKSRFFDKTFEELQDEDKRRLKNSVLRSFQVQQLDPNDDTSKYHIFERLNTGGTLASNQEIRNCVYWGRFVEFLPELNRSSAWREILGRDIPDTRQKDLELLVRFFAMRDISAYDKPLKDFLTKFMKKNRDASQEVLVRTKEVFEQTCNNILNGLGPKPFHIRAGLNAAVFDAVMVAFSNHLDSVSGDIKDRYRQLVRDREFDNNTRQATTDVDTVRLRFSQANKVLFG